MDVEKKFFVIDSANLDDVKTDLYGYALTATGIYESDNLDRAVPADFDGTGCYVLVEVKGAEIRISQDCFGCFGLYLYRAPNGDFALSNSFFALFRHMKRRGRQMTIDRDYANHFLVRELCSHACRETPIREIVRLDRDAVVVIDKISRSLAEMTMRREWRAVPLNSVQGVKILDMWYLKWLRMIRGLCSRTDNVEVSLSGGFDSRITFMLALNSGVDLNAIRIHSINGTTHTHAEDYRIATKIAQRFGFALNAKDLKAEGEALDLKQILDIAFSTQMAFHKEIYFKPRIFAERRFRIPGNGGGCLRGHWGMSRDAFLSYNKRRIRLFDKSIAPRLWSSMRRVMSNACDIVSRKYGLSANSRELGTCVYLDGRMHNHFGLTMVTEYLSNSYALAPLMDAQLYRLRPTDDICDDPNLLMALMYVRFCPDLLAFEFEGGRAIDESTIAYAKKINSAYPFVRGMLQPGRFDVVDQKGSGRHPNPVSVSVSQITGMVEGLVRSKWFQDVICRQFGRSFYAEALDTLERTSYVPLRDFYGLMGLSAVVSIVEDEGVVEMPWDRLLGLWQPKVSVVIPAFNVERYLPACLDSLCSQTYRNFEAICIDDGSTDGTLDILREYAKKDGRIKVYTQVNKGAGAARNLGIEKAGGDYLAFADPDDILASELISDCVAVAGRENSDVVCFRHLKFDSDTGIELKSEPFAESIAKRLSSGRITYSPDELRDCLFTGIGHAVWSKLFRRDFILAEKIRFQELRRTNDLYFADMALLKARRISFLDEVLYRYRKGIASTTTNDSLVGMCFVGYGAVRDYLVSSGRYPQFAADFIRKAIGSLGYELRTIKDSGVRKRVRGRLTSRFLDVLPLHEIARFYDHHLPPWLVRLLWNLECSTLRAFRTVAPLDDPSAFPDDHPVSVIIPVYNAYEPLCNLVESLFRHTADIHEILFINDASPDERIRPYLEGVCQAHPNATLINNEKNMGFPHNVNLGASRTTRDFVILNTDTEVPDRWLPRLFAPLRACPETTGSVTPMSTDALELTLPGMNCGGAGFVRAFGLANIDRAVSSVVVDPERDVAWRGLGFAMAISRRAWNAVGPFSEEVFGRGYHEESDWCFRARRCGFENRVAANVVIPHLHNGSFSITERKALLKANFSALKARNPEAFAGGVRRRYEMRAGLLRQAGRQALISYGIGYLNFPSDCNEELWMPDFKAYRVGMFVTWPARCAYRMFKCYRENGLKYTLRRLILGEGRGRT